MFSTRISFKYAALSLIFLIIIPACLAAMFFSHEFDSGTFWEIPSRYVNINAAGTKQQNTMLDGSHFRIFLNQSYLNTFKSNLIFALIQCLAVYVSLMALFVFYIKFVSAKKTEFPNFKYAVLTLIFVIIISACIAAMCFSHEFDSGTFWEIHSQYVSVNTIAPKQGAMLDANRYQVFLNQSYLNKFKINFIFTLSLWFSMYLMLIALFVHYGKSLFGKKQMIPNQNNDPRVSLK